jgi:hypothetical protein
MMVDRHRVEAGQKGAKAMWAKRRKREAVTAAKMASLDEALETLLLLAHPKFTTDEAGNILYYVTKSDVETARDLLSRATTTRTEREGEKL